MKHSKYGASSSHRWLNCPGSVKLSETVPTQAASEYALEGTAAHKLGEVCILENKDPSDWQYCSINLDDGSFYPVSEDMIEAVTVYVDYVRERSKLGNISVETQFDLSFIHKDMFGTNDACMYSETLGILEVIDYKHGAGIAVSPVNNTQLAYYGLGAAAVYDLHPDSQIKLTVVQPRAAGEPIKSWTTTVKYLKEFAKELKDGIAACEKEEITIDFTKHPVALIIGINPLIVKTAKLVDGDWCRFCPALAVCPQVEKKSLEIAKAEFDDGKIILPDPNDLKPVDIKKILDFSPILSSWLKSVEAYAFNELESGRTIDGYKLVKKRANRKWKDEAKVKAEMVNHLKPEDIYSTPKLKSPAQLEKLVDKDLVASLCETPDNGNTMAPVSDKRPEVLPAIVNEFDVIED